MGLFLTPVTPWKPGVPRGAREEASSLREWGEDAVVVARVLRAEPGAPRGKHWRQGSEGGDGGDVRPGPA